MADNLLNAREIVITRLNVDGSPLTSPTDADIVFMNYPQRISFGTDKTADEEIVNNGPEGAICTVNKQGKLKNSRLGLQLAKVSDKLRYIFEGGSYDMATGKHTPPYSTGAAPNPFKVEAYIEKYTDGDHLQGDLDGYKKLIMPKCTGTIEDMSGDGSSFINPNVNVVGKEYVDGAVPANSIPCYDFSDATVLPGDADQDVDFTVKDALDAAVASATITMGGETGTTDAGGLATIQIPPGVYTYSVTKSGLVTATGTVEVGLLGAAVAVEMAAV